MSPNRKRTPSPVPLPKSKWDDDGGGDGDDDSPVQKKSRQSPESTFPIEKDLSPRQEPKDDHHDKHSSEVAPSKKHKESRRKSDTSEAGMLSSPESTSQKTTLGTSIYGKVTSFTDTNAKAVPAKKTPTVSSKIVVPNGTKTAVDDGEDVEADLRAEFLNNNDALYDSQERTQPAGFPLVTRKKAEKILDDLPIDPLTDGQQYVSKSVERDFDMSNGDKNAEKNESSLKDDWTPEMITKLKVKKEEIIQVGCYIM